MQLFGCAKSFEFFLVAASGSQASLAPVGARWVNLNEDWKVGRITGESWPEFFVPAVFQIWEIFKFPSKLAGFSFDSICRTSISLNLYGGILNFKEFFRSDPLPTREK